MDDIDRLRPSEIRQVFQLVKANADFPNFVYFLPFQRDLIEKALNDNGSTDGEKFLEKIIQVGFDIPGISQSDVDNVLEEKLNVLFADEFSGQTFDKERWVNIYYDGVRHYLTDLRRVKESLIKQPRCY